MTLIRLTDHGAISDALMTQDGEMVSGLPLLTCPSGPFAPEDEGKDIVVAGAGAAGTKLRTTVAAYVDSTQLTLAANASTTVTGAGVAWGTDCSAALQAALAEADARRGGSILVDGDFLLAGPVATNFFSTVTTSYVRLLGSGTDSSIVVAVDPGEIAISLASLTVDVERISFVGVHGASVDARRVLSFSGCTVSLLRCQFLGISTSEPSVYFTDSWATLDGNMFGGTFILTGGSAGSDRSVVYNVNWHSFEDRNSQFIDYGYWRGMLLGKSGVGAASAWVGLGTTNISHLTAGTRVAGIAAFRGTRMDEGSLAGVWAEPESGRIPAVELSGTGQNISPVEESSGIRAKSVDNVLVDRSTFGLSPDPGTAFGRFEDCGRVEIDSVTLLQSVDRIVATNVEAVIVRDTEIANYDLTGTAFYPRSSAAGGLAMIKAGAISDSDFPEAPGQGALAFDRTNGRLYLRSRGDWVYFDMAGGSLLGPELVPNGSGSTTAGWTPINSTLSSVSDSLRVTITAPYGRAYTEVPVEIGTVYVFSAEIVSGIAVVRVGRTIGGAEYLSTSTTTSTTFTAAGSTTLYVTLIVNREAAGQYAEFRNISIRAA